MQRIVYLLLLFRLLFIPTAGITGCGGTESGTQQNSEKAQPDPETLNPEPKSGKQPEGSRK